MSRDISAVRTPIHGPNYWAVRTEKTQYVVELNYNEGELNIVGPGLRSSFSLQPEGFLFNLIEAAISDIDLVIMGVILTENAIKDGEF